MSCSLQLDCFDEFTARFIHAKAASLIGRAGFREADRVDLIQEFALNLLERRRYFDPAIAPWEAFVVVVCENHYANVLEYRGAACRSAEWSAQSVNTPSECADGPDRQCGFEIDEHQSAKRNGRCPRPAAEQWELQHDQAVVLADMPPLMRRTCELLKRHRKSHTARLLGMSPGAFYEMRARILKRFERAGLRGYLK